MLYIGPTENNMKIIVGILSIVLSLGVFAQETHSPTHKCTYGSQSELYIFTGNSFSQNDFDWSNEVILGTLDDYHNGHLGQKDLYNLIADPTSGEYTVDGSFTSYPTATSDGKITTISLVEDEYLTITSKVTDCKKIKGCKKTILLTCSTDLWNQ